MGEWSSRFYLPYYAVVEAKGLGKKFGRRWVFRNVEFSLGQGDALLVVGPNGSGKSTLLKVVAGLVPPSAGSVQIDGDPRLTLGYAALDLNLYPHLSACEHLELAAELKGCDARADELLDKVGLIEAKDKYASNMSTGMRMRLKLALAIQSDPDVLLLDEPGASLDESGRELVKTICREHQQRGALIVATNDQRERELGNLMIELKS